MQVVSQAVEKLEIGIARTFANLTVLPLLGPEAAGEGRPYKTLDQALTDGSARVTEVSEEGNVPELRFVNDNPIPVLLLDGEEVVGAKQNRILNLTILVPANKSIVIPVSCVEAGRWSRVSRHFRSERHVMPSPVRGRKMAQVSRALAREGKARSDQGRIWNDISALCSEHQAFSPTHEMRAVFHHRANEVDEYVNAFPAVDRQVGALFALGSEVRGVEILDHHATLRELLPKIIRSWALDAKAMPTQAHEVPTAESAKAFLDEVVKARSVEHDAVGLGRDVRFDGHRLAGGALVHNDGLVHLCAFRLDEGEDAGSNRGFQRGRMARASRRGRGGRRPCGVS